MNYKVKIIRITTSDKIQDRFLTCQVHNPIAEKAHMGSVFAVVEILNPWFPTSQIGQTIINTLIREYYKGESTSDLENFEKALQKVNESLAQITQNGETDWIGNLNSVLGLICNDQLHLAQTGKAEGYLFRTNQVSHITENQAAQFQPHPLKTFSNITSGAIQTSDKILISSPQLFSILKIDDLGQLFSSSKNISEAALLIVKNLQKARLKNTGAILLELQDPNIPENPDQPFKETYYLDKPIESSVQVLSKFSKQRVAPGLSSFGKKIIIAIKKIGGGFVNIYKKISSKIGPAIKKGGEKTNLAPEPGQESPSYQIVHYDEKIKKKSKFGAFFALVFGKISAGFKYLFDKKHRLILYVVIGTLCLIVIIVAINSNRNKQKMNLSEAQAKQELESAKNLNSQAKLSLSYGDKDQAKNLFTQSMTKLIEIKNHPWVSKDTKSLIQQVQPQLDQLTSINRLKDLQEKAKFDNASKIYEVGNGIYTIDPKNNNIYRASLLDGRVGTVGQIDSKEGLIKASTYFSQNKSILIYTNFQKIFQFKIDALKVEPITIKDGSAFESGQDISAYLSNIYILSPQEGQIFKHTSVDKIQYLAGSSYTSAKIIDLSKAISFAIDGDIYILNSNGETTKMSKGRKADFSLKGIPEPGAKLTKPTKILTNSDLDNFYILDNGANRILEFSKDGNYNRQYVFENKNLQDFTVNQKEKKLWTLADNKIYEIDL